MRKLMESGDLGKFANFPTLLLSSSEEILVSTLSTWLRPSPSIRRSSTSTRISLSSWLDREAAVGIGAKKAGDGQRKGAHFPHPWASI